MIYHQILAFLRMALLYFRLFGIRIYQLTLWIMTYWKLITAHISGNEFFNPSKQTQEVIFSLKIEKPSHPVLIFNNNQLIQTPYQKDLSLLLDEKLNFAEHLRYIANKVNTSIGLYVNFKNVYWDDH